MVATALTCRVSLLVVVVAFFVPWEARATCLTPAEANQLVAETARELGAKRARKKAPSLQQLARVVAARTRATESRAKSKAWGRLYTAMQPLVTGRASCALSRRNQATLAPILQRLLARPDPAVFEIVSVQYLFLRLAEGEPDSWS